MLRIAAAIVMAVGPLSGAAPDARLSLVFTQVSGQSQRLVRLLPDGTVRVLSQNFFAAADPEVSFDGQQVLFAGKKQPSDRWQIHEMSVDGTGVRQLTRETMECRAPLYQSGMFTLDADQPWHQVAFAGSRGGPWSLYSVLPDGSKLRRLTYDPYDARDPFLAPDGRMLFSGGQGKRANVFGVSMDGADFALFSGPEGPPVKRAPVVTTGGLAVFVGGDGALGAVSMRRNLHSFHALTTRTDGQFDCPSPLPGGSLLVSRKQPGGSWGIWRFDPSTRRMTLVYDDPAYDDLQPKLAAPRAEPDGRTSMVDESEANGRFYCLSVYTSDAPELLQGARRVRVVEGVGPALHPRLLGELDLDGDGSFQIQTPANTPVKFQIVDADGVALRSCAWVWNKNKENRGCIGCHEDGELTPENRFATALGRPAVALTLPPDRRRTVRFDRDVAPVLEAKCASCHRASRQLRLEKLIVPGAARESALVRSLLARGVPAMPPPGAPALTPEQRRTIVEWIDLGALTGGTQ